MKLILFGPPGSGKGTQAKFIRKYYKIPQISVGDILRKEIHHQTNIGKKAKKKIENGQLINDEIIISLIKKRIVNSDCHSGFLLDGYPRTLLQAQSLKIENIKIDFVFEFYVAKHIIFERILGRRIHISSGRTYHVKFNPPIKNNQDDYTGEELSIRKDDTYDILKFRLLEYQNHIHGLRKFYNYEDKLGNVKYYQINGEEKIKKINKKLIKIIS